LLAEKILARFASPPARVLDVGTGSGILALTLAAQWPEAEVHAVDVSELALALAKENAAALQLEPRVCFHQGSLMEPASGTFHCIVANLPYVPTSDMAALSREVQRDPALALDGGPEGTSLIRALILSARPHLQGLLALEIGHAQSAPLAEALAEAGYTDICPESDYNHRNRFLFATYG
jgi:release factor glutamine methyltransferase